MPETPNEALGDDVSQDVPPIVTDNPPEPETVDRKEHDRVRHDMHKYKEGLQEEKARSGQLLKKLEDAENAKLESNQNWKELAEKRKTELAEAHGTIKDLSTSVEHNERWREVRAAANKAGIRQDALEDLAMYDLSSVIVEKTERGHIVVSGAEEFITAFKKNKPFFFKSAAAPSINSDSTAGVVVGKPLSAKELLALQQKDPAAYNKAMAKRISGR